MYRIEAGKETLLMALRSQGVSLEAPCNGKHLCGKCKLRVLSGQVSPMTQEELALLSPEERREGIRLACLTRAETPVEVASVRPEQMREDMILQDGYFPNISWSPQLRLRWFAPLQPSLENQYSLWECVARPLGLPPESQPCLSPAEAARAACTQRTKRRILGQYISWIDGGAYGLCPCGGYRDNHGGLFFGGYDRRQNSCRGRLLKPPKKLWTGRPVPHALQHGIFGRQR